MYLSHGKHATSDRGMCVMEAAAFMAGERHTDHPLCVDPVIAELARKLNDELDADKRQDLILYIPRMIGTAGDGLESWRRRLVRVQKHKPEFETIFGRQRRKRLFRLLDELIAGPTPRLNPRLEVQVRQPIRQPMLEPAEEQEQTEELVYA